MLCSVFIRICLKSYCNLLPINRNCRHEWTFLIRIWQKISIDQTTQLIKHKQREQATVKKLGQIPLEQHHFHPTQKILVLILVIFQGRYSFLLGQISLGQNRLNPKQNILGFNSSHISGSVQIFYLDKSHQGNIN